MLTVLVALSGLLANSSFMIPIDDTCVGAPRPHHFSCYLSPYRSRVYLTIVLSCLDCVLRCLLGLPLATHYMLWLYLFPIYCVFRSGLLM
jgi:hypothetical protein